MNPSFSTLPEAPAWAGYAAQDSPVSAPPVTFPLITVAALQQHLDTHPAPWRAFPDGRPLRLTSAAIEFIVDDFGGYEPDEVRSAHRILYFASRTDDEMDALWIPSVPRIRDAADSSDAVPALNILHLQREISAWAGRTFEPGCFHASRKLAFHLWKAVVDRMPVSAQKKSDPPIAPKAQESAPSTSATSHGSLVDQTLSAIGTCSPESMSSPSFPPSSIGSTSEAFPASPSQSGTGASPASAATSLPPSPAPPTE